MEQLAALERTLAGYRGRRLPQLGGLIRAAVVAAILRTSDDDLELLLIRRPRRAGDRWSGNLAFPGGLQRPDDRSLAATAVREAREEVGLDLGQPVGRLSDLVTAEPGRRRPMRIVPLLFRAPDRLELAPDPREVADAFWVGWRVLESTPRYRTWRRIGPVRVYAQGLDLHGTFLWGLTLAMIDELVTLRLR